MLWAVLHSTGQNGPGNRHRSGVQLLHRIGHLTPVAPMRANRTVRRLVEGMSRQGAVRQVGLAEAVQTQRMKMGFSARALSLEAGLSPSYVGKLEGGEIEPSVKAFAKIALALGLNQSEIAFCVLAEALHESPKNFQEQGEAG